ncbi:hypothetical protein TNCV_1068461 [Trichonephila clavipes]|nr:hypothetical protein TNCV_1068461 [Trichonephila clavipes]
MRTRCLKCGESHRTNECPIKDKIQNPLCINCNKTGHMANWSQCEEFPKRKPRKVKRFAIVTPLPNLTKPQKRSPQISPSQLPLSGASKQNNTPGTPAATEKPLQSMKSNDKDFGFKDAIRELRRFFSRLPLSFLEMGRQFSYAKDEERLDIFYQNLVNNQNRKA